ncbi:hypothetical protein WMY93_021341 [Mugilogobius chulae]|uniref:U1-type domain-containing protein n=1 Tax=Mugilogobius chulae TaxID=88201 RepID=A0AAW0NEP2_9GOBI
MFNPHIHHQHQQQQHQFQQHLRQLQQLFHHQQQPPPPPPPQPSAARHVPHPHQTPQPPAARHVPHPHQTPQPPAARHVPHPHQTPRAIPVPHQGPPPPRMVNLCQTTQTTIIAPNPMLQGALLMQQMQGNMRGFAMGGQQFRQFFAAGARSSLLGPIPMGVAIKSPMMGFPPARPVYPHVRYYNNNSSVPGSSSASSNNTEAAARQSEKRDIEQVTQDLTEDQPGPSTATEANDAGNIVNPNDGDGCCTLSEEQLEEPVMKKQKTHGFEEIVEQPAVSVSVAEADCEILSSDNESQPEGIALLYFYFLVPFEASVDYDFFAEAGSVVGSEVLESENENTAAEAQESLALPGDEPVDLPMMEEQEEDSLLPVESQEEEEEDVDEGTNKFYCYLCSITCHNQQNFRNHMNSISHQQRMMEIQHMSNACLVTLLPRLQDSLQGTAKDGEKKSELKRWCATCQTHFTSSVMITARRRSTK